MNEFGLQHCITTEFQLFRSAVFGWCEVYI